VVSTRLDHKQGCCSAADAEDARRVADRLDIPFYAVDFQEEFGRIMDYFVEEYSAARTPNPCIMCNNWLKFGKLFEFADSVGAEYVATGHYARIESSTVEGSGFGVQGSAKDEATNDSRETSCALSARGCAAAFATPRLLRGVDAFKDQSYVLFGIDRRFLERMLLPIGGFRKDQIRALAAEVGLQVAGKRDSQEICFVTSGNHADFVRRRRRKQADQELDTDQRESDELQTAGEIVTTDGAVLGHHEGIEAYTIGQRKGLGIAFGEPRYVVRIEANTRRVVIGTHDELARTTFTANRANWLIDPPAAPFQSSVQIRYNSAASPATVTPHDGDRFEVALDAPRFGIAPGQAAVCYLGDQVLGGGWIE
jgi:tRNA-uridine 2-sulfurtransferase